MLDLTVVIVSYNSYQTITSGLSDVIHTNKFSVIVIDNDSPDGSAEKLKKSSSQITLPEFVS
jgi:GT2 family glycosyltransferase